MWIAYYTDGTSLNQFNRDSTENLFKDIIQDKLESFKVIAHNHTVSINLLTGKFCIDYVEYEHADFSDCARFELIYYKSVEVKISTITMKEISRTEDYNIGCKSINTDNKSISHIVCVKQMSITLV